MHQNKVHLFWNIDIYRYPEKIIQLLPEKAEITIGDLHGNTMKLIYFLVKYKIIQNITPSEYSTLSSAYLLSDNLTEELIEIFEQILKKIKFNSSILVRLIGYELADRGKNDYLTLLTFSYLAKNKTPFEIIFSNHGAAFILAFEKYKENNHEFKNLSITKEYSPSMTCLNQALKEKVVSFAKIEEFFLAAYKPNIKIVSYSIRKNEITLYSHAPMSFENIRTLAEAFEIEYQDGTINNLASTIDQINIAFHKNKNLSQIYQHRQNKNFLYDTVWNRKHDLNRPPIHHNYKVRYVHGHDADGFTNEHIINLDQYNIVGKSAPSQKNITNILQSKKQSKYHAPYALFLKYKNRISYSPSTYRIENDPSKNTKC